MNFLQVSEWIIKGGPVMPVIIAGSVIGLAIVLEKFWSIFFLGVRHSISNFPDKLFEFIQQKKFDRAATVCSELKSPLARILEKGLQSNGSDRSMLEALLEREANKHMKSMERGLGILLTIVGISPMLGFLGTITGLIRAFMMWEQLGNKVTVGALAGGMYESMITTAAGLIVAIPLYLCYNAIVGALKTIAQEWNDASSTLIDHIAHKADLTKPK